MPASGRQDDRCKGTPGRHERMFNAAIPALGMTPGVANPVVAARAWKVVLPGKGMGLPESA